MNDIGAKTGSVQLFEPEPGQRYTVDAAAYLAGVSRRTFLLYCRSGLVEATEHPATGALLFDDASIAVVRQAEALRRQHSMDIAGVRIIFELRRELERMRRELQFLRGT